MRRIVFLLIGNRNCVVPGRRYTCVHGYSKKMLKRSQIFSN